jgi:nicotinamide riboside transporter PnuC
VSPLHWTLALVSLVGVVLNVRKDRRCYLLWLGSNLAWAEVDLRAGLPAQASLMLVYAGLAVWGWLAWRPPVPE